MKQDPDPQKIDKCQKVCDHHRRCPVKQVKEMSHRVMLFVVKIITMMMVIIGKSEGTFWKKKIVEVIPDDCNCVCPPNKYIPVEVPHTQLKYYPVEEGHLTEDEHYTEVDSGNNDDHSISEYEQLPEKIGKQVYEIVGSALGKGGEGEGGGKGKKGDEGLRKYADSKTSKPQYQSRPEKSANEKSSVEGHSHNEHHSHSDHSHSDHSHSDHSHSDHSHSGEGEKGVHGGDDEDQVYVNHLSDSKAAEEEPKILYHHTTNSPEFDSESFDKRGEDVEGGDVEEPQNIDSLYGSFDSSHKHSTSETEIAVGEATTESAVYAMYPSVSDRFKNHHHTSHLNKKLHNSNVKKYHKYETEPKKRLSKKEQDLKLEKSPKSVIVHSKWHFFKEEPNGNFKSVSGGEKKNSYSYSTYKFSGGKSSSGGSTSSPSSLNGHFIKSTNQEKSSPFEKEGGKGSKIVLSKVVPSSNAAENQKKEGLKAKVVVKKKLVTNSDAIAIEEKKIGNSMIRIKNGIKQKEKPIQFNADGVGNFSKVPLHSPFMTRNTNQGVPHSRVEQRTSKGRSQIKDWETASREDFDGTGFLFSGSQPRTASMPRHENFGNQKHQIFSTSKHHNFESPKHGPKIALQRNTPLNPLLNFHEPDHLPFKPKPIESRPKLRIMLPDYY